MCRTLGDPKPMTLPKELWTPTIKLTTYDVNPTTGYVENEQGRLVRDIYIDIKKVFDTEENIIDEYFNVDFDLKKDARWPVHYRWVACYAVTGGSEGHYVHVDLMQVKQKPGDEPVPIVRVFTVKTFRGMEYAQALAAIFARLLDA